jgi:hypothetical protein
MNVSEFVYACKTQPLTVDIHELDMKYIYVRVRINKF